MVNKILAARSGGIVEYLDEIYIDSSVVEHTSGNSLTLGESVNKVHINPASPLATLVITLPSTNLFSGKGIAFFGGGTITTGFVVNAAGLSFAGGTVFSGDVGGRTELTTGETFTLIYLETDGKWRIY